MRYASGVTVCEILQSLLARCIAACVSPLSREMCNNASRQALREYLLAA